LEKLREETQDGDHVEGSRGGILQSDLILVFPVELHDCRTKIFHLLLPISWIPSFQTTSRGTGDSRDATSGVYVRTEGSKERGNYFEPLG
jgi:hypothetical protein